jgi:hypothetical protein
MTNKSKLLWIVFGGGGLIIAAIASCAGFLFVSFRNTEAAISPRIDNLFAAIEHDAAGDSYLNDITPEFRSFTSEEQFKELAAAIRARLGLLKSKQMTSFSARQFNMTSYVDVAYSAVFEKGSGTITARLQKQNGKWMFAGFQVNSPIFQQALVTANCPKCGKPHAVDAKFCPTCGAALAPATAAKQEEAADSQSGHGEDEAATKATD